MKKQSFVIVALLLCIAAYGFWRSHQQTKVLSARVATLEASLKSSEDNLNQEKKAKDDLVNALNEAGQKNALFASQVEAITNEVETLERLATTDPQLLQKYSKIYFLNENYKPSGFDYIDTRFLFDKNKPLQIHVRVWPFLSRLLFDAQNNALNLQVASAYRSFGTQANLKSNYKVTYGAGTANSFSADQGYSEHQLATAVDFTSPSVGGSLTGFDKAKEFEWLKNNAHRYGFILSYPANNNYYVYEPWHWRFVGVDLATRLHNEGKNFYDLDQREISLYLVNIFKGM